MPRKYTRKTDRASWKSESMAAACQFVHDGGSFRHSAAMYGVPRSTLERHFKQLNKKPKASNSLGRPSLLGHEQEEELVNHILAFEMRGFPMTKNDILSLVSQFASRNDLQVLGKDGKIGQDWYTRQN